MTHPDVLILGGGIIGLACARELALRGFRVELVERLPAGAEASLAAAGMLSPLGEISTPGPLLDICRASRDLWGPWVAALESETGLSVDYDTSGALLVALDEEDEAELDRLAFAARELGERADEVEIAALRHWVPDVTPGVRRALHLPDEHRVDNVQLCAVLAQAVQKLGVVLHYDSEVERVERRPRGHGARLRPSLAQGGAPARAGRRSLERRSSRSCRPCRCGPCAARCCCWAASTGPGAAACGGGSSYVVRRGRHRASWWARP